MFRKVFLGYVLVFAVAIVVGLLGGLMVWTVAPEVGGSWWPYIRFVVSAFVAFSVAICAAVLTWLLIAPRILDSAMEEMQEEMDNFSNNDDNDDFWM